MASGLGSALGGGAAPIPIVSRAYPEDWQLSCTATTAAPGSGGGGSAKAADNPLEGLADAARSTLKQQPKLRPVASFPSRPTAEELVAALQSAEARGDMGDVGASWAGAMEGQLNALLGGIKNIVQ